MLQVKIHFSFYVGGPFAVFKNEVWQLVGVVSGLWSSSHVGWTIVCVLCQVDTVALDLIRRGSSPESPNSLLG